MDIKEILYLKQEQLDLYITKIKEIQEDIKFYKTLLGRNIKSINYDKITDQELKIILYVQKGLINKEIAAETNLSINTIKKHLSNIYLKTGLNRYELIKFNEYK